MSRHRFFAIISICFALHLAWPIPVSAEPVIVNDVTQLNPVAVERVVIPKTVDEIRDLVRSQRGPISIGGARHSMGGQIATERIAKPIEHAHLSYKNGQTPLEALRNHH